jgi:hypothetical protein
MNKVCFICLLLAAVILSIDLVTPLGVAAGIPYIAVVLLSLKDSRKVFTVKVSILCSLFTLVGFFLSPPGGELWEVICNRFLILFAIWVTALLSLETKQLGKEREMAIDRREKALEDIKILRGFLPICAACKKIRDDKGYWSQIEDYIQTHSEADFSHGICPDCAKKLYPEFFGEEQPVANS